jgi:hypothetical protein
VNKSVADQFNHWDLPRDGRTLFLYDDEHACNTFLDLAADAVYILIPGCYSEYIAKWAVENKAFQLAPMTEENMQGGFIGTCLSVEMFTDAFAEKGRKYPAGAPCVFGQWGGKFSIQLETERSPYYAAKRNVEEYSIVRTTSWMPVPPGIDPRNEPERILIPRRFYSSFLSQVTATDWHPKRGQSIEQQFDGHTGWFRNVPVLTDDYLNDRMINPNDLVEFHYKSLYRKREV